MRPPYNLSTAYNVVQTKVCLVFVTKEKNPKIIPKISQSLR